MKNNTTKQTENEELTSYEQLCRKLDAEDFAYEFKLKTLDRAKNLIGDILSVTTGNSIVTENNSEWGHGVFLELFEILSIRHKNFFVPDFLENLSDYLFTWTFASDAAVRNWREKTLAERGLDEHGIKLETPIEADSPIDAPALEAQTQPERPKAKTLAEHHLQIMANKISHILRSDKVSDDARAAFSNIIFNAANESNIGVDEPELIKISLPLIVNSLEFEYGRGVVSSLSAILDSSLVDSVEDELRQYEKRFDGRDSEFGGSPSEPDVLGLSDSSIEDLAQRLSDIMHDPHLPEKIHNCLADELAGNCIDFRTPESILGNLKEMKKAEVQND